eukprot:1211555-Amphidinium_carterae.3
MEEEDSRVFPIDEVEEEDAAVEEPSASDQASMPSQNQGTDPAEVLTFGEKELMAKVHINLWHPPRQRVAHAL